jgi:hypothetical protein
MACRSSLVAEQLIRLLALRFNIHKVCPITTLHIPGDQNAMTDISSRSFGSEPKWYFHTDLDLLTFVEGKDGHVPISLNQSSMLTEEMCRDLPHVMVCLLGKFKREIGMDHHLIIVASKTVSGLRPRWWLENLVDVCESEGRCFGPAELN